MNFRETYTKHRRLIIGIVCLLALAVLLWFVFRKVKTDWEYDRNAEREFILKERDAARARITADSIAYLNFQDSMYKVALGIETRVEYIVKWRTEYVTRFIDTASIARKIEYVDSVLGPK